MLNNFRYAAHAGGDNGQSGKAGFKQCIGETLFDRGKDKNIECSHVLLCPFFMPEKYDVFFQRQFSNAFLNTSAFRTVADDYKCYALIFLRDDCGRFNQIRDALGFVERRDGSD